MYKIPPGGGGSIASSRPKWSQQNYLHDLGVVLIYANVSMCFGDWGVRHVSSIKKELFQIEYSFHIFFICLCRENVKTTLYGTTRSRALIFGI